MPNSNALHNQETDKKLVNFLGFLLKDSLLAINQYFLHARILKHQGLLKLADHEYKKSIEQMNHADKLIELVLGLGGVLNLQNQNVVPTLIGSNAHEMLKYDLMMEEAAVNNLHMAIAECEKQKDEASLVILKRMLKLSEGNIEFILSELNVIDSVGLNNYSQKQD